MIQDIEKLEYQFGFVREESEPQLPARTLSGSKMSPELYRELWETNILNCSGTYGDKSQPHK